MRRATCTSRARAWPPSSSPGSQPARPCGACGRAGRRTVGGGGGRAGTARRVAGRGGRGAGHSPPTTALQASPRGTPGRAGELAGRGHGSPPAPPHSQHPDNVRCQRRQLGANCAGLGTRPRPCRHCMCKCRQSAAAPRGVYGSDLRPEDPAGHGARLSSIASYGASIANLSHAM